MSPGKCLDAPEVAAPSDPAGGGRNDSSVLNSIKSWQWDHRLGEPAVESYFAGSCPQFFKL